VEGDAELDATQVGEAELFVVARARAELLQSLLDVADVNEKLKRARGAGTAAAGNGKE